MSLTIFALVYLFSLVPIDGTSISRRVLPDDLKSVIDKFSVQKFMDPDRLVNFYIANIKRFTKAKPPTAQEVHAVRSMGRTIAASAQEIHSCSVTNLLKLFTDNAHEVRDIHPGSLLKAIVEIDIQNLEKKYEGFLSIVGKYDMGVHVLAFGIKTRARQIYKDMYEAWIIRQLTDEWARAARTHTKELHFLVKIVLQHDRALHDEQLIMRVSKCLEFIDARDVSTSRWLHAYDVYCQLFKNGRSDQYADFQTKLTTKLTDAILRMDVNGCNESVSLFNVDMCMELNRVFVAYPDNHNREFVRLVTSRTGDVIEADVKHSVFHNHLIMDLSGKKYLLHKNVLDSLEIGYVIKVPASIVHLYVSCVGFNEEKLKLFQFQSGAKLNDITMNGHEFQSITWGNFGKYFGTAANNKDFKVLALGRNELLTDLPYVITEI